MGWWSRRVVPRLVEASLDQEPVARLRARACAGLHGRVVAVGFGSGLDLPHLPGAVVALDAVEPSDLAWERSAARRAAARIPVERVGLDGRRVAAPDAAYDAALLTFTLYTVPDAEATAAELARLLAPGGAVHLLEHGLAPDPAVAAWQRRLDGVQRRLFDGCRLTRDPAALLAGAGLEVDVAGQSYLAPGPARPWGWLTLGRGVRPAG